MDADGQVEGETDGHIFYAVKLMVFSILGLGWLSVREYVGDMPVTDASALLAVVVLASMNLVLALAYPTVKLFEKPARAFFSQILALTVFYTYSLAESMSNTNGLGCKTWTYTAAYFGNLPLHEMPAALTLAFLLIYLIMAAGQARICRKDPKQWLVAGTGQAVLVLVVLHLALFVLKAPANPATGGGAVLVLLVIIMWVLMLQLDWLAFFLKFKFILSTRKIKYEIVICTGLMLVTGLGLAGAIANGIPLPLFLVGMAVLAGEGLSLGWTAQAIQTGSDASGVVIPIRLLAKGGGNTNKNR